MYKKIKSISVLLVVILISNICTSRAFAQKKFDKQLKFEERVGVESLNYVQVSESVIMVHNEKAQGSNMTCIALDDGLVFFDCSLFTEVGQKFRADMEQKYERKTLALVQTHAHSDHFFGMGAFEDVPIIASAKAQSNFNQQLAIDFEKYKNNYKSVFPRFDKALESAKLRQPNIWFEQELVLGSGDSKLILRDASGHTDCSIYAYFEKEKVIVTGDNVQVGYYPYFGDQSGNLYDWINVLKVWEGMDIKYVCAGHGPVTNKDYIAKTRSFFEKLMAKFEMLHSKAADLQQIVSEVHKLEKYWPESNPKPGWYDPAIVRAYNKTFSKK